MRGLNTRLPQAICHPRNVDEHRSLTFQLLTGIVKHLEGCREWAERAAPAFGAARSGAGQLAFTSQAVALRARAALVAVLSSQPS